MLKELRFPSSMGLLYLAVTCFTSFPVKSGEYKLIGLVPDEHGLLRVLLQRPRDFVQDGRAFPQSAANVREQNHAARDRHRSIDSSGDRRGRLTHGAPRTLDNSATEAHDGRCAFFLREDEGVGAKAAEILESGEPRLQAAVQSASLGFE